MCPSAVRRARASHRGMPTSGVDVRDPSPKTVRGTARLIRTWPSDLLRTAIVDWALVSNRQDEKQRRREERLAAEKAVAASDARARRLRLLGGAGLAAVLVIAIIVAVSAGGSGSGASPKSGPGANASAKLPAPKITNLAAATKAAGCVEQDFPKSAEDRSHVSGEVTYKTNPPAFGPHAPTPASDGDYAGQGTPTKEMLVHAMEHGRVEIQYRRGLPRCQVNQLEALFNEPDGSFAPRQFALLYQNNTAMPYAVAATAWTHILGCPKFNPHVFDALRAFRAKYTLKGPELINQPE